MADLIGIQWYPTPEWLGRKMLEGIEVSDKTRIVDPSAGRGDLLDITQKVIDERYHVRLRESGYDRWYSRQKYGHLYAIEIDPNWQAVLREKGYKVIDSDFLGYGGEHFFDLFLMNPPFEDGDSHLLHAWRVAHGATIRCLLNAETIRNPYSQERKELLHIINEYGHVEELGQAFRDSERPADVDVVLVTLKSQDTDAFNFDYTPETVSVGADIGEFEDLSLVSADVFEGYEASYRAALAAYREYLVAQKKVTYYLKTFARDPEKIIGDAKSDYHAFLGGATQTAWDSIFRKTKLAAVTTEAVQRELENLQKVQGQMAFTAPNMRSLLHTLVINKSQIMIRCVLDAFDEITKYNYDNRNGVEGWKTNAGYKVPAKFILPNIGSYYGSGIDYRAGHRIADIEKALCFIAGRDFAGITSVAALYSHNSNFGRWVTSIFFETQLYQRRTMHFKWRNEGLLNAFNQLVAEQRAGEVPEKTKQGVYA